MRRRPDRRSCSALKSSIAPARDEVGVLAPAKMCYSLHLLPDAVLDEPEEQVAAWVPEDHAGCLLLHVEEVQALAQETVIVFVEHCGLRVGKEAFRSEH